MPLMQFMAAGAKLRLVRTRYRLEGGNDAPSIFHAAVDGRFAVTGTPASKPAAANRSTTPGPAVSNGLHHTHREEVSTGRMSISTPKQYSGQTERCDAEWNTRLAVFVSRNDKNRLKASKPFAEDAKIPVHKCYGLGAATIRKY